MKKPVRFDLKLSTLKTLVPAATETVQGGGSCMVSCSAVCN